MMSVELTERELAVLERFVEQQTNAEIARDLILSVGTVKWYAQQIYNKLDVSDRKAAVARAQQLGLLHNLRADERVMRAFEQVPNNLPAQFTTFIGREREVAQVRQLLMQTRLLTLTGPGGVGKTRLAIQCAGEMLTYFPDGVYWVGLFALNESKLIIHAIASALGVRESAEDSLLETLQRFSKQRRLLLVLDNYEHLLPDVDLILTLLTAAPHLRILVTSREALHVIGEQEVAIGPLAVPADDQTISVQSVNHHPATALFVLRASAVKPDFVVTDATAPVISEICRRLDGLPLALELAAARIKLFTPQTMLARLSDSLTMLSNPLLDASGRRHTLRATIDWSYGLLNEDEKLLFRRLSVFAGGWSLSAVDALCQDLPPEQVLNGLGSLADKSLIRQEIGLEGESRFSMLYILREYARAQLAQSTEADEIPYRHAAYFLARAEAAAPELHLGQQEQWLLRLEEEHDNLRVALEWLLERDHTDEALRMVAALGWFWVKQDHHSEGFDWVKRALDHPAATSPELRAKAILFGGGRLAYFVEQMRKDTRELLVEALAWARAVEERYCEAWALGYLGLYHEIAAGEYEQAIARCEEALAIFRQVKPIDQGSAWVLNALGVMQALRGNFDVGRACLEESLTISRQMENGWGIRLGLMNLGLIAYQQGDYEQARRRFLELFPLWSHIQHRHDMANWLCAVGLVCAGSGQRQAAMVVFGGVDKLLTRHALRLSYPLNHYYEAQLAELRQSAAPSLEDAWQQGHDLSDEEIIEYVINDVQPPVPA
jgi:predicted ATPase/DNA-binding CsgD family transcriptional regulator